MNEELMKKCEAEILRLWMKSLGLWPHLQKHTIPPIKWDLNSTRTAGYAYCEHDDPSKNRIRLNPYFLRNEGEEFVKRTPGHELAHIVSSLLYGRRGHGHGSCWRSVMRAFGLEASRCHSYDSAKVCEQLGVEKIRVHYRCPCREHHISTRKHANIVRRGMVYRCAYCHKPISRVL